MQQREIQINNQYPELSYQENQIKKLFETLDKEKDFKLSPGDLSIAFMNDEAIGELHNKFLNDPSPTDVITFPGDKTMNFAGEICISIDHAISAAKIHKKSISNEITLYLIHGWLHLVGYNDITLTDRNEMRSAEHKAMNLLKGKYAIPNFSIN